jgi:hypothetical protein
MKLYECDGWCETTHTHVVVGCDCGYCSDDFLDGTGAPRGGTTTGEVERLLKLVGI